MKRISKQLRRGLAKVGLRRVVVAWRHRGLMPQDVFLASYPKSGNSWLKHLLVQLLTGSEHEFYREGRDPLVPQVGRQSETRLRTPLGGRMIKTHEPYRSCYRKVLYVVRDARDVAVSNYWFHSRKQNEQPPFESFLRRYLAGQVNAYGSWLSNVESWMRSPRWDSQDLLLIRYEDLHRQPLEVLGDVCTFLSLEVTADTLQSAVAANSFDSMRQREQRNSRMTDIESSTGIPFVRKGTVGQWQELFSAAQLREFDDVHARVYEQLGYQKASVELAGNQ